MPFRPQGGHVCRAKSRVFSDPSDGIGKSTPGTRGARRRVLTFEAWLGGAGIRTTTEGPSRTAGGQHVLVAVASPAVRPVPSGLGGPDRQEFR